MRYIVIAVRDRAADCFASPHFVANTGGAIRGFADEVNRSDPQNQFYNHPDDFDLYELGFFYDESGQFELHDRPRQIAIGKDLKRSDA